MDKGIRMGIDIGGTFTDFTIVDAGGQFRVFKTLSTPGAPEQAVFSGIQALADEDGITVQEFLGSVDSIIHGTTIATNTVLERNGPKIGILHTNGFRDTLYLRDGRKPDRYNLHLPPPDPLIPRYLRLGVDERTTFTGEVLMSLDEQSVRAALAIFRENDVESIAVCLLWSFLNPRHEAQVLDIIKQEMPQAYVALSSDVLPAMREYPRASATMLSAYVGPVLGRYLTRLAAYLVENAYGHDLLIMQVTGGSAIASEVEKRPVLAIGSGPAAGPAAGLVIGGEENEANLMLAEMGGTSFEVSLVTSGAVSMSQEISVEGMPIGVAAVDIHSIGAGGGSIAWIDAGGMLRIGPRSAGADPGPSCYGRGGEEPTVTDANVILGYLNPDFFLGGRMRLDREASGRAIQTIAKPLGLDVVETAAAIYRIVNTNMVGAMRAVSVMRGIDPRDYTLIVGGGAGGTHAAKIAEDLGMARAICPVVAGGLCAFGMLVADVQHSYVSTHPTNTARIDVDAINEIFHEMGARGLEDLMAQGFSQENVILSKFVDAKYPYQFHELIIPLPLDRIADDDIPSMADAFHDEHQRLYNYCMRDMSVDMIAWRVTATGVRPKPKLLQRSRPQCGVEATPKETRPVFFEEYRDYVETPIYDGEKLATGVTVAGPAVAELTTSTLVVFPGHTLTVNPFGDFHIEIPQTAGR